MFQWCWLLTLVAIIGRLFWNSANSGDPFGLEFTATSVEQLLKSSFLQKRQHHFPDIFTSSRGRATRTCAHDAPTKAFVWLSDLHADPYYGRDGQQCTKVNATLTSRHPFGIISCDPPFELFNSAVAAAKAVAGDIDFVLFSGDFARHKQSLMPDPAQNVSNIIEVVAEVLASAFPKMASKYAILAGDLGNDDSPGDYELNLTTRNASNPWLDDVASILFRAHVMNSDVVDAYRYGGYFEQRIGGITLLSINTIIYSVFHSPHSEKLEDDPFYQFRWLRERLTDAVADGRKVWIIGHIPPGIETFAYTELWFPQYLNSFLDIVADPNLSHIIAAQLYGHVHADEFRLFPGGQSSGPILLTGALSPVYTSLPSFRVVEYNSCNGGFRNYKVFYANISQAELQANGTTHQLTWKLGYDLQQTYASLRDSASKSGNILTQDAFRNLSQILPHDDPEFQQYASWYKTRESNDLMLCTQLQPATEKVRCIKHYICGLTVSRKEAFEYCAKDFYIKGGNSSEVNNFYEESIGRGKWKSLTKDYYTRQRLQHLSKVFPAE